MSIRSLADRVSLSSYENNPCECKWCCVLQVLKSCSHNKMSSTLSLLQQNNLDRAVALKQIKVGNQQNLRWLLMKYWDVQTATSHSNCWSSLKGKRCGACASQRFDNLDHSRRLKGIGYTSSARYKAPIAFSCSENNLGPSRLMEQELQWNFPKDLYCLWQSPSHSDWYTETSVPNRADRVPSQCGWVLRGLVNGYWVLIRVDSWTLKLQSSSLPAILPISDDSSSWLKVTSSSSQCWKLLVCQTLGEWMTCLLPIS